MDSKVSSGDFACHEVNWRNIFSEIDKFDFSKCKRNNRNQDYQITGTVELILGPMFSGKSTELMRKIDRFIIAKNQCVIIKYEKDTRYSDKFCTHDLQERDCIATETLENLFFNDDICEKLYNVDVIGIDEGQFFGDHLRAFCQIMAAYGKKIIIAALDGTFERKPWDSISNIIPICDKIHKLTAICDCGKEAPFTQLKNKKNYFKANKTENGEPELIGGSELYQAVCRDCYGKENEL